MSKFERTFLDQSNVGSQSWENHKAVDSQIQALRKETRKRIWKNVGKGVLIGAGVGTGVGFAGALGIAAFAPTTAVTVSNLGLTTMGIGAGLGAITGGATGVMAGYSERHQYLYNQKELNANQALVGQVNTENETLRQQIASLNGQLQLVMGQLTGVNQAISNGKASVNIYNSGEGTKVDTPKQFQSPKSKEFPKKESLKKEESQNESEASIEIKAE